MLCWKMRLTHELKELGLGLGIMKVHHSDAMWPELRNTGRRSSGSSSRDRHWSIERTEKLTAPRDLNAEFGKRVRSANSADLEKFRISEETPWVNMRYPPITWHDMTWRDFMLSFGTQCGRRVHRRPLNSTVLSFWLDLAFRSHVTWWHVERWYENCLLFTEADNMEADRRGFQGSWYEFAVLEWMPGRHMFISFFCKLVELCNFAHCDLADSFSNRFHKLQQWFAFSLSQIDTAWSIASIQRHGIWEGTWQM